MSYIQGFNYSFIPSLNLGGSGGGLGTFPQLPFPPTQITYNNQQQQQQYPPAGGVNPSSAPPSSLSQGANLPIPESIAPNPQSYVDYYGNPKLPSSSPSNYNNANNANEIVQQQQVNYNTNQQQQTLQQQQFQQQQQQYYEDYSQPQQQQQQPRRRRPKNGRNRGNNYGPEHVQQFQNFQNTQQPQTPSGTNQLLRVTPIQGPIFAKDGYLPVVPLYTYPAVKNGTLLQIPVLWTALSYALGLEIRGEILRGLPCIKRLNQLFCPTAGNTYPLNNIERFIDENKALIKRMYGEFSMSSDTFAGPPGSNSLRRNAREIFEEDVPPILSPTKLHQSSAGNPQQPTVLDGAEGNSGNATLGNEAYERSKRQTVNPRNGGPTQQPKSNRVDSCESTVEIVTPYWAANSAGKVRAIVNTQHFEQAIHQEVCTKTSTKRCTNDCGCEQKYKWHRLLAYDPDNDCRGIFMDWFLFPSCCVCRCNPTT